MIVENRIFEFSLTNRQLTVERWNGGAFYSTSNDANVHRLYANARTHGNDDNLHKFITLKSQRIDTTDSNDEKWKENSHFLSLLLREYSRRCGCCWCFVATTVSTMHVHTIQMKTYAFVTDRASHHFPNRFHHFRSSFRSARIPYALPLFPLSVAKMSEIQFGVATVTSSFVFHCTTSLLLLFFSSYLLSVECSCVCVREELTQNALNEAKSHNLLLMSMCSSTFGVFKSYSCSSLSLSFALVQRLTHDSCVYSHDCRTEYFYVSAQTRR